MLAYMQEGDFNNCVKLLQLKLNISADGVFGPGTKAAVIEAQKTHQISPDGVVRADLIKALGIVTTPVMLSNQDYVHAALELGVEVAAIKAFSDTETGRESFLPDGSPAVLFERGQLHARLAKLISPEELAKASEENPDLCNASWGGYIGGEAEYGRIDRAMKLCASLGVSVDLPEECSSWGKFQIMGYYWKDLGYTEIGSFYRAALASEIDHLEMFVRFIRINPGILNAVRRKDWTTAAREYNGTGQVAVYAERLEQNYRRESMA